MKDITELRIGQKVYFISHDTILSNCIRQLDIRGEVCLAESNSYFHVTHIFTEYDDVLLELKSKKLKNLNNEISSQKKEIAEMTQKISSLELSNVELEKECDNLRKEISIIEERLSKTS